LVKTNLLKSIINISKSKDLKQENYKKIKANNKIKEQGEGLEIFIKDSFCKIPKGSTLEKNRIKDYLEKFSDTGNANNPPDAMIKGGDAIEIKKKDDKSKVGSKGSLQLNSSPPKSFLSNLDKNIQNSTKKCEKEPWEKEYLYVIGNIKSGKLWRVTYCYGNCFVSPSGEYSKIFDSIKNAINKTNIGTAELIESDELGRIKKIDPQDFTTLRIRSMFELKSPNKIFENKLNWKDEKLVISAIMRKEKFYSFPKKDRESLENNKFKIDEFKGKDPKNPSKEIDLVLVKYSR
jgi:hypothetical protein